MNQDSKTTTKTKKTTSPQQSFDKFNKKVSLIYNSPFYQKLNDDQRKRLDGLFYDKVLSKYYNRNLIKPPSKEQWQGLMQGQKLKLALQSQPSSLKMWVGHEPESEQHYVNSMISKMGQLDRAKYYGAKVLDKTLEYFDKEMMSEAGTSAAHTKFLHNILQDIYPDAGSPKGKEKDSAQAAFGKKVDSDLDAFNKKYLPGGKDPIRQKLDIYFKNVEPQVNNDLRTKIFGGAAGFIPDLILFKGLEAGMAPIMGTLEAGKITSTGGSLLQKFGGLTKVLESTPTGRTAYRMIKGTMEGYGFNIINHETQKNAIKDAPTWGAFSVGLGMLGGALSKTSDFFSKRLFADLGYQMGAETVAKAMENTIARQEQNVPPIIQDQMLMKLDETNAKVLNQVTKEMFGQNKFYQTLPKTQKAQVVGYVRQNMKDAFANPAAFSKTGSIVETNKAIKEQASTDPVFAQQMQKMQTATQKVTGKPYVEGPAEQDAKQAQQVERVVPGAASGKSPEFLDNLTQLYHHPDVGFEDSKHKVLMMWANKDHYPPNVKQSIENQISQMYKGLSEKQLTARFKFLQDHIDKLNATWDINPQGDKKRVFRSTELTRQKATEYQKELWELYDSTFEE